MTILAPDTDTALEVGSIALQMPKDSLAAKNIGADQYHVCIEHLPGRFDIWISADHMKATIVELEPPLGNGRPIDIIQVRASLATLGVNFGIDDTRIETALRECLETHKSLVNIEIARGLPAKPGKNAEVAYHFRCQISAGESPPYAMPGDLLIVKTKMLPAAPGRDLYGKEIKASKDGLDIPIRAGPGIEIKKIDAETEHYVATSYGRIQFKGDSLEIASPVTIAADKSAAFIDIVPFSENKNPLQITYLKDALLAAKVTASLQQNELETTLTECLQKKTSHFKFKAARMTAPQHGKDACLELVTQAMKVKGLVRKGELLARKISKTQGIAGTDVLGKTLSAQAGKDLRVELSNTVEVKVEGSYEIYRSKIHGMADLNHASLDVSDAFDISKDAMFVKFDFHPIMADGSPLSAAFVHELLAQEKINFGIDNEAIERSVKNAVQKHEVIRGVVIAAGLTDKPGKDGRLEKKWVAGSIYPFARSGDILAVLHPPEKGQNGRDVFGTELRSYDGKPLRTDAGEGVVTDTLPDGKTLFKATHFGKIECDKDEEIFLEWTVEISEDEMQAKAFLPRKTFTGASVTLEDVLAGLQKNEIRSGYCTDRIQKFLADSQMDAASIVLAEGQEPTPRTPQRLEYLFSFNDLAAHHLENLSPNDLKEAHSLELVRRGQPLVKIIPPEPGKEGLSLFGTRIPPPELPDPEVLEIDKSVQLNSKISCYVSAIEPFGYVDFTDRKLSVKSPLQMAEDKLSASVSIYPPSRNADGSLSTMISCRDLVELIQYYSIKADVDFSVFEELSAEVLKTRKPLLNQTIIYGNQAHNGTDEKLKIMVELEKKAGELRKDNSIDFRERHATVRVKKGQTILTLTKATDGYNGQDILGNTIFPNKGNKLNLTAGKNIEIVEEGTRYSYRATKEGLLISESGRFEILDAFVVDGNVNFSTGNLRNETGSIVVKGSVLPGFTVTAQDDIIIEDCLDNAKAFSEKNIFIHGGILGREAAVNADGDVETSIVNHALVIAKGKITIARESYFGRLCSWNIVRFTAQESRINGGTIQALHKINATNVGNSHNSVPTHLMVGKCFATEENVLRQIADSGMTFQTTRLKKEIDILSDSLERSKRLPPDKLPSPEALQSLQSYLFQKKKAWAELVKKQKDLMAQVIEDPNATVDISGKIYPDTRITILDATYLVKETMEKVRFKLNADRTEIIIEPL